MARTLYARGASGVAARDAEQEPDRYAARCGDDASGVLVFDQTLCAQGRGEGDPLASYLAAFLRDSSHQSWRRSARGADAAWPSQFINIADIHSCGAGALEGGARGASSPGMTSGACAPAPAPTLRFFHSECCNDVLHIDFAGDGGGVRN